MRPDVGAVVRDVDRHVADDGDPPLVRRSPEPFPLAEEEELDVGLVADLVVELDPRGRQSVGVAMRQIHVPVEPGSIARARLERGVEGPVRQPIHLLRRAQKGFERVPKPRHGMVAELSPRLAQQAVLPLGHRAKVDGVGSKVGPPLENGFGNQPIARQHLRREQQGVARERRRRRVWRAASPRRPEREHLPQGLARRGRPIQETVGLGARCPRCQRAREERSGAGGCRRFWSWVSSFGFQRRVGRLQLVFAARGSKRAARN